MTARNCLNAVTATLVANTEDTITLTGFGAAPVEVVNLSTTATDIMWCRFDGTVATVDGAECIPIPANSSITLPGTPLTLSVISAGTPKYNVSRLVHS